MGTLLFKLGSKSAFCTHETHYLQNKLSKSQQLHQQQCRKRKREIVTALCLYQHFLKRDFYIKNVAKMGEK
jgi:hypothetical protein